MSDRSNTDQAIRLYMEDGRSVFVMTAFCVSVLILSWSGLDLYFAADVFYQLLGLRISISVLCVVGGLVVKYQPSLALYERLLVSMSAYTQLSIGTMIAIVPDSAVEKYLLGHVLCILGLGSILLWRIKSFVLFSIIILIGQTLISIVAGMPFHKMLYIIIVTFTSLVIAGVFVAVRSRVTIHNYLQKLMVDERTEHLNKIFASVDNAIAMIGIKNREPYLSEWRSASFDRAFAHLKGREVSFLHFLDEFQMSDDHKMIQKSVVESAVGEKTINFELNVGNLASRLVKIGADGKRTFYDVAYSPLNDQDDTVVGILVSMLDVSERLLSEERARENKILSECMIDVIRVGYGRFIRGVQQLSEMAMKGGQDIQRLLKADDSQRRRFSDELFADLHTIKGNARALGFTSIANQAHNTETILSEIRQGSVSSRAMDDSLSHEMTILTNKLGIYRKIMEDIGGHESNIVIAKQGFKKAMAFESWRDIRGAIEAGDKSADELRDFLSHAFLSLYHALGDMDHLLEKTAQQLGKASPSLRLEGHNPWLTADAAHDMKAALIHMANNALDHGIEAPEERKKLGKPDVGIITVSARRTSEGASISITDDGRGLALEQIRELLIRQGADPQIGDCDVALSIFQSGLSTKQCVTEISGRGVGMAAVKDLVEKHGGTVSLALGERRSGGYCAFEITIDLPVPAIWY